MKNRTKLSFKFPNSEYLFRKNVNAYNGYGIAQILKNIDKNNNSFVRMLLKPTKSSDHVRFSADQFSIVLKTLSDLKKNGDTNSQTIKFLDYLINLEDLNSKAPKLSGNEISSLLKVHKGDINKEIQIKAFLGKFEVNNEDFKLSNKDQKLIDSYLDNGQYLKAKKLIERKRKPVRYLYDVKQIVNILKG